MRGDRLVVAQADQPTSSSHAFPTTILHFNIWEGIFFTKFPYWEINFYLLCKTKFCVNKKDLRREKLMSHFYDILYR